MTPLADLQLKLIEAQLVVASMDKERRRRLADGAVIPMAALRKVSRARAEVRRLEALVRAGRIDQTEYIVAPRFL